MSELFPLHEWKEKEEDDRIAFAIHFATGVKSRMPAPPAVRNIEHLVKMTILNTNGIAGAPSNDALMLSLAIWQLIT